MAAGPNLSKTNSQERSDLVAYWSVPLSDGVHSLEFEHGTTSGKRVIRVDGKEILRRDWMFKLVGDEKFTIGDPKVKCELKVDPLPHFAFSYSLIVDGKTLEKFTETQNRSLRSWACLTNGKRYRVVFDKNSLIVRINGHEIETTNLFTTNGTEINFFLDTTPAVLKAIRSDKKQGIIHQLYVDGKCIPEDSE